jgi:hypothetical protein
MQDNVPTPPGNSLNQADQELLGRIRVDQAVKALTAFGGDLNRSTAARLLTAWQHVGELADAQQLEVLKHFRGGGDRDMRLTHPRYMWAPWRVRWIGRGRVTQTSLADLVC